jgi:hypothetical protein
VRIYWDPLEGKAIWNDHGHGGPMQRDLGNNLGPMRVQETLMVPWYLVNQWLDLETQYFPKTRELRINANYR